MLLPARRYWSAREFAYHTIEIALKILHPTNETESDINGVEEIHLRPPVEIHLTSILLHYQVDELGKADMITMAEELQTM